MPFDGTPFERREEPEGGRGLACRVLALVCLTALFAAAWSMRPTAAHDERERRAACLWAHYLQPSRAMSDFPECRL